MEACGGLAPFRSQYHDVHTLIEPTDDASSTTSGIMTPTSSETSTPDESSAKIHSFDAKYMLVDHADRSCYRQLFILHMIQAYVLVRGPWYEEPWMTKLRDDCRFITVLKSERNERRRSIAQKLDIPSSAAMIERHAGLLDAALTLTSSLNMIQEAICEIVGSDINRQMPSDLYSYLLRFNITQACNDVNLCIHNLNGKTHTVVVSGAQKNLQRFAAVELFPKLFHDLVMIVRKMKPLPRRMDRVSVSGHCGVPYYQDHHIADLAFSGGSALSNPLLGIHQISTMIHALLTNLNTSIKAKMQEYKNQSFLALVAPGFFTFAKSFEELLGDMADMRGPRADQHLADQWSRCWRHSFGRQSIEHRFAQIEERGFYS